jgi:UDP-N-acetylmuramate--alanine ligase
MVELQDVESIHVVGVGGSGMSALAKLLDQMGFSVTGSDLKFGPLVHELRDRGIEVWEGSRPERGREVDLLVVSSAVGEHDPEVRAAKAAGVEVWARPRLLGALTQTLPTIGATGTHGKTSSAAMLVKALRAVGRNPSFVIGGVLSEVGTNASLGDRELLVLEVDEAFGTFLDVRLRGLMVTNIESEHLDYYETLDRLEDAFCDVVRGVEGPVVIGVDDPGGRRLAARTGRTTYGTSPEAAWRIADVVEEPTRVSFRLHRPDGEALEVTLPKPGLHLARNAAGVLALLAELDYDLEKAAQGLASFAGVHRRFEARGTIGGVTIVDDYAIHPTEIAATLRAASAGGYRRIWAVFQPHRYSRTLELHREFGAAFAGADEVVVTDVYAAWEAPVPGVTGELVADAVETRTGAHVTYVSHRGDLAAFLADRVAPGDLVLTLGAGDISLLPDELARLLAGGDPA